MLDLLKKLKSAYNETLQPDMRVWKDSGGTYRVMLRYSNKFRDDDYPVKEIIAEESHKKFVQLVKAGLAPLPEIWIWHNKDWRIGQTEWVDYDDSGFAVAMGYIYPEFAEIGEALATVKGLALSHGMPGWSIQRDESDPSVITQHITTEISVLPLWAAANKLTGVVLSKESDDMGISLDEKRRLVEDWKIDPALIDQLEAMNAADAAKANGLGIESKEADTPEDLPIDEKEQEAPEAEAEAQPEAEEKQAESQPEPTRAFDVAGLKEIGEALQTTMLAVTALGAQVKELTAQLNEVKTRDEDKVAAKAASSPYASLAALMQKSVIGDEAALIDGRTKEAQGPEETPANPVKNETPFPFVNNIIAANANRQRRSA